MSAAEQLQPATAGQLDEQTAQQLVDDIRAGLLQVDADVARAYHGGAAAALGYGSGAAGWAALCRDLFTDVSWLRPRNPEARTAKVLELRRAEMPTRAIGDAIGVSAATVQTELNRLRDRGEDLPSNVIGLDGHRRSATGAPRPEPVAPPRFVAPADVTLTELMRAALEAVWLAGDAGLTLAELADGQRWREGRCSSLLHRLERAGLVARGTERRGNQRPYQATSLAL